MASSVYYMADFVFTVHRTLYVTLIPIDTMLCQQWFKPTGKEMSYETLYTRKMYYLHLISQILFEINTAIHVATSTYLDFFMNAIWFNGIQTRFNFKNVKIVCSSIFNTLNSFVDSTNCQQSTNNRGTEKKKHFIL